ncbi:hypothetical protein ACHAWF_014875 [Thalassiosira exigua]
MNIQYRVSIAVRNDRIASYPPGTDPGQTPLPVTYASPPPKPRAGPPRPPPLQFTSRPSPVHKSNLRLTMVKYAFAALALLSSSAVGAAASHAAFVARLHDNRRTTSRRALTPHGDSRRYSAIPYDEFEEGVGPGLADGLSSLPSAAAGAAAGLLDELSREEQDEDDVILAKKEERRAARMRARSLGQRRAGAATFQVSLPIVSSPQRPSPVMVEEGEWGLASLVARGREIAVASTAGMSLRQVYSGRRLSELALDVDTLRFQSFADELQGCRVEGEEGNDGEQCVDDTIAVQILQNSALESLPTTFDGVVVSSVAQGGLAYQSGVRAGDVLTATSATVGGRMWPKSTLDGVRSAVSSRRVVSGTMDFEFKRTADDIEFINEDGVAVEAFQMSLSRPIGINVEDTDDGYVTVVGISDKAAPAVRDSLRIGDRVVSVESAVGGQMWDVSSTDGLTSAVTSRLPGQPVRIAFERVRELAKEVATGVDDVPTPIVSASDAVIGFRQAGKSLATVASASASTATSQAQSLTSQTAAQKMLLSRSRDLLRTYIARNEVTKNVRVADRVIEAVVDAGAVLDGRTLTLLMKAYNTCGNAEKAIQTFEEVFDLAGDGSEKEVERVHGGKLCADMSALNVFSISALLHAHAVRGDYESVLLVMAAMEGKADPKADPLIKGKRPRSWSGKGDPLNMIPDTRCYNIALAAAAKRGTKESLQAAVEIFESMPDPSLTNPPLGKPAKTLVTYNTMMDAFANAGRYEDAHGIFRRLKGSNVLRPDEVTYTTLIKASIRSGEIDRALDLFDDMKWTGLRPDIVSYNSVIESLCGAGRLYEAKDLVTDMETTGQVAPNSMTYGLLMRGLLRANKPGPCLTLFESACADTRTAALTEDVRLYTTAISAAAALGDHERALDLVARMNRVGVRPNKKTLTALMGACIAGRKYDAAADVFSKIKSPDGHAVATGLGALCLAGRFDDAMELIAEQRSGQKTLTGKQVMVGYNKLIQEALSSGEYNVAREALSGLLGAGYIPSKATFRAIMDGLSLQADMPFSSAALRNGPNPHSSNGEFKFLLFVLDSLDRRNLTVDSAFYSSILVLGAQTGGLQKRIASLVARARKSGSHKEITVSKTDSKGEELPSSKLISSWEDLLENYSNYKKEDISNIVFPPVRVSSKEFGRVLAAEQAVSYRGRALASRR